MMANLAIKVVALALKIALGTNSPITSITNVDRIVFPNKMV
jgi:hypothetical protein